MKHLHLGLLTAFAMVLTAGCASGPPFKEYMASATPPAADQGRIYFYRTSTAGAAVQPQVMLNDESVGKAVPGGFFYVDRDAGDYTVSASTEAKRSLDMSLAEQEEKYVRLEVKMGFMVGHIKPVLVDQSVGKEEIVTTKHAGE